MNDEFFFFSFVMICVSLLNLYKLPEKEREPTSQERRHDNPERSCRFPFSLHLATAGHRRFFRLRIGRLVHGRQRSQTGGDPVDLQVLVEKSGCHFAPETILHRFAI